MIVGNLIALQQHNIKRLLAYSSIGQVGYMLMGIVGALARGDERAAAAHDRLHDHEPGGVHGDHRLPQPDRRRGDRTTSAACRDRAPLLAAVLAVALFSLAGMPLFAGFLTKFILFQSVADNGYFWLAARRRRRQPHLASTTTCSVMREMYVSQPDEPRALQDPDGHAGRGRRPDDRRLLRRPLPGPALRRHRQRRRRPVHVQLAAHSLAHRSASIPVWTSCASNAATSPLLTRNA